MHANCYFRYEHACDMTPADVNESTSKVQIQHWHDYYATLGVPVKNHTPKVQMQHCHIHGTIRRVPVKNHTSKVQIQHSHLCDKNSRVSVRNHTLFMMHHLSGCAVMIAVLPRTTIRSCLCGNGLMHSAVLGEKVLIPPILQVRTHQMQEAHPNV